VKGYMEDRKRLPNAAGEMSSLPDALLRNAVTPASLQTRKTSSKERIFVGSEITVNYLNSLGDGMTGIQAQALRDIYIGKWMKVSGRLGNVLNSYGTFCQVTLKYVPLKFTDLYMIFGKEWRDRLSIMTPGQNITVMGKIDRIDSSGVQLGECELIDS
jgi:hypothetical protein